MRFTITKYERKFEFEMDAVAQLCGQNVRTHKYIFDSLAKYFGTYKYSEQQNPYRDNVLINNEQPGRKYYQLVNIIDREHLMTYINMSKQSLLLAYVKRLVQDFECQKEIEKITEQLDEIFIHLNKQIGELGPIEFSYNSSEVWDIVQESELCGHNEEDLDLLSNFELLKVLLNVIKEIMELAPENFLVLIPNVDHLLEQGEYKEIYEKLVGLYTEYNIHSIVSFSLDGYAVLTKDNLSNVSVFGIEDFIFPEFENLKNAIQNNYPISREIMDEELLEILGKVIQKIGMGKYLVSSRENVICKIINGSLMITDSIYDRPNQCVDAFLSK